MIIDVGAGVGQCVGPSLYWDYRGVESEGPAHWPKHLRKALADPFDYACAVAGLGVVRFTSADVAANDWVRLNDVRADRGMPSLAHCFERGIEVPLSAILWVADAPDGS